jgi:hypothetical protein
VHDEVRDLSTLLEDKAPSGSQAGAFRLTSRSGRNAVSANSIRMVSLCDSETAKRQFM